MINRIRVGVIDIGKPVISIPVPVDDRFWSLAHRIKNANLDVNIRKIGNGYHNAGWRYYEYEISAISDTKAFEIAEELNRHAMIEFQLMSSE